MYSNQTASFCVATRDSGERERRGWEREERKRERIREKRRRVGASDNISMALPATYHVTLSKLILVYGAHVSIYTGRDTFLIPVAFPAPAFHAPHCAPPMVALNSWEGQGFTESLSRLGKQLRSEPIVRIRSQSFLLPQSDWILGEDLLNT